MEKLYALLCLQGVRLRRLRNSLLFLPFFPDHVLQFALNSAILHRKVFCERLRKRKLLSALFQLHDDVLAALRYDGAHPENLVFDFLTDDVYDSSDLYPTGAC